MAGGAVYVGGHYGKAYVLNAGSRASRYQKCQFCASVPGYSAAATSVQITAALRAFSVTLPAAEGDGRTGRGRSGQPHPPTPAAWDRRGRLGCGTLGPAVCGRSGPLDDPGLVSFLAQGLTGMQIQDGGDGAS